MKITVEVRGATLFGRPAVERLEQLTVNAQLRLEPEPTNKYDRNAIRVVAGGQPIGYIERDRAATLAAVIAQDPSRWHATLIERIQRKTKRGWEPVAIVEVEKR